VHLVIGAAGYAGRHAVAALDAYELVRTAELHDDLAEAMRGVEVVHLAAGVRSPLVRPRGRAPHPRLVALVGLARDAGVRRVVFLSSTAVYGFSREGRVSDRTRARPEHPYGRALAADETWNSEFGLAVRRADAYNLPPPSERHGRLSLLTGDPDLSYDTRSS